MMPPPTPRANLLDTILSDPELLRIASDSQDVALTLTIDFDAAGGRHDSVRSVQPETVRPRKNRLIATGEAAAGNYTVRPQVTRNEWGDDGFVPERTLVPPGKRPEPATEYRLVGKLGSGGTGIVYQAHQRAIDREVAVKVLRDELVDDPIARRRFLAEARTIGSLDHPNVIALHELAVGPAAELFYSMKRIDGTSWDKTIDEMSFEENLETIQRICDAIRYAHSRGLIHRDIKPENVMIGRFGEVLLADWGLALSVSPMMRSAAAATADGGAADGGADGAAEASLAEPSSGAVSSGGQSSGGPPAESRLFVGSAIGGTPAYMAPELACGDAGQQNQLTDIYLLGGLLYRVLTGNPPHYGENLLECIRHAANNEIVPSSIRNGWMDIALRAMATEPADRFPDVAAFSAALNRERKHERSTALVRRAEQSLQKAGKEPLYQDFAVAEALIREALEVWPNNATASETLANIQIQHARVAAAAGDFDLALELLDAAGQRESELAARINRNLQLRQDQASRESKFSRLFSHSPDAGLLTRWSDGEIVEVNRMFESLTGFDPQSVVGRSIMELNLLVSEDGRSRLVEAFSASEQVRDLEIALTHRQGHPLHVSLCASRVEMNQEIFVLSTFRDIGLRVAARRELADSRQRLRDMQRLAQLGTWHLDIASGKVRWNDQAFKIAGLPLEQDAPDLESFLQTVHPDDRAALSAAIDNTVLYRTSYELCLRHARSDQGWNTVIARGQPRLNDQGEVTEIYGVVLDISRYILTPPAAPPAQPKSP